MPGTVSKPRKKVRTGCITCKIRKVKCDEAKPACKRCSSTGRKCDGYLYEDNKRVRQRITTTDLLDQRTLPSVTIDAAAISSGFSPEERQWLSYFSVNTGPALSGPSDKDFWSRLLPQLSASELAIRHALLAVSASHARFRAESDRDQALVARRHSFTIRCYNQAIVSLQSKLAQKNADVEVPLICCILFICLECLYGNRLLVLDHLRSGLNILNSASFRDADIRLGPVVKQKLFNIMSRLDAQSTMYGKPTSSAPDDVETAPASALPSTFSDIHEAQHSLETILFHCLNFIESIYSGAYFAKLDSRSPPHSLLEKLQFQLLVWKSTFELSLRTFVSDSFTPNLTRVLRVQYLAIFVYLSNALTTSETAYDAYLAYFAAIVQLAKPSYPASSSSSPSPPTSSPIPEFSTLNLETPIPPPPPPPSSSASTSPSPTFFSLDASLIPSLFLVAIKCRHPRIRREAIALLDAKPGREGLWDSRLHGAVARRVLEIEEAEMRANGFPLSEGGKASAAAAATVTMPEERCRVHRADIQAEGEQGGTVKVTFYTAPDGSLGQWRVWDEDLGVAWSGVPVRKKSAQDYGRPARKAA